MPTSATTGRYTSAQNEYLRLNYPTAPQSDIEAQFPARPWKMVQKQASRLNCGRRCPGRTYVSKDWPLHFTDFLRANYPEFGALPVAAFTGLSVVVVRSRAAYLGIRFLHRANVPKLAKTPRAPRKAAVARVPRVVAAKPAPVAPLLPVKLRPTLPNLNASKEARKKAERAAKAAVGITAEQVRRMDYNDPARRAYMLGGVAGWRQWQTEQAA